MSTPYNGVGNFSLWRRQFERALPQFTQMSSEFQARHLASRLTDRAKSWYEYLASRHKDKALDYAWLIHEFHKEFDDHRDISTKVAKCQKITSKDSETVRQFAQRLRTEWQKQLGKSLDNNPLLLELMASTFRQGVPKHVQTALAMSKATKIDDLVKAAVRFEKRLRHSMPVILEEDDKKSSDTTPSDIAALISALKAISLDDPPEVSAAATSRGPNQPSASTPDKFLEASQRFATVTEALVQQNQEMAKRQANLESRVLAGAALSAVAGAEAAVAASGPAAAVAPVNPTTQGPVPGGQPFQRSNPNNPVAYQQAPPNQNPRQQNPFTTSLDNQMRPFARNFGTFRGPGEELYCRPCNRIGHSFANCRTYTRINNANPGNGNSNNVPRAGPTINTTSFNNRWNPNPSYRGNGGYLNRGNFGPNNNNRGRSNYTSNYNRGNNFYNNRYNSNNGYRNNNTQYRGNYNYRPNQNFPAAQPRYVAPPIPSAAPTFPSTTPQPYYPTGTGYYPGFGTHSAPDSGNLQANLGLWGTQGSGQSPQPQQPLTTTPTSSGTTQTPILSM